MAVGNQQGGADPAWERGAGWDGGIPADPQDTALSLSFRRLMDGAWVWFPKSVSWAKARWKQRHVREQGQQEPEVSPEGGLQRQWDQAEWSAQGILLGLTGTPHSQLHPRFQPLALQSRAGRQTGAPWSLQRSGSRGSCTSHGMQRASFNQQCFLQWKCNLRTLRTC